MCVRGFQCPSTHPEADLRRRIRRQAYVATPAADFLTSLPSAVSRTYDEMWTEMLRRHLGVHVFDDNPPAEEYGVQYTHGPSRRPCCRFVYRRTWMDQSTQRSVASTEPRAVQSSSSRRPIRSRLLTSWTGRATRGHPYAPASDFTNTSPPLPTAYDITVSPPFD